MHTFSIILKQDPDIVIAYIKKEIESNSGQFKGDCSSGTFSGKGIEGLYYVGDNIINITLVKKPFYIPVSLIEKEIRRYFPE